MATESEVFTERFFELLLEDEKGVILKDGYLHFNEITVTRDPKDQFTLALSRNGTPLVTYGGLLLRRGDTYRLAIYDGEMKINVKSV
jgi:hypothetical protein